MTLTGPQKAIVGAIISSVIVFLTAVLTGLQALGDGAGLGDLTMEMWVAALIALLGSAGSVFGGVYYTTNKPKSGVKLVYAHADMPKGEAAYVADESPVDRGDRDNEEPQ